jgi:hypothetical protein
MARTVSVQPSRKGRKPLLTGTSQLVLLGRSTTSFARRQVPPPGGQAGEIIVSKDSKSDEKSERSQLSANQRRALVEFVRFLYGPPQENSGQ